MLSDDEVKRTAEQIRDEIWETRGVQTLQCRGRCMRPILGDDAEVTVRRCAASELSIGDIVLYRSAEGLMLHRFLRRTRAGRLTTKADNAADFDPLLDPADVVGRVTVVSGPHRRTAVDRGFGQLAFRLLGVLSLAEALAYRTLRAGLRRAWGTRPIRPGYRGAARDWLQTPRKLLTRCWRGGRR